jgi:hypothetical protein
MARGIAPVAGMIPLPLARPSGVVGIPKVVAVLWLGEPAPLPCRLPGRPTRLLLAVLLATAIAHIHREICPAAQALAFSSLRHGSLAWGAIFTDEKRAAVVAPGTHTGGKKIETNKTI